MMGAVEPPKHRVPKFIEMASICHDAHKTREGGGAARPHVPDPLTRFRKVLPLSELPPPCR
jgi:hypothetical protein